MATSLHDIIQNTKKVYITDSNLTTLLDFERVIDELDIYTFLNWKKGELVEGPIYEKYFVTCVFMWPQKLMPDPRGAERLLDYGCEIRYKKSKLIYPIKVNSPNDFEPGGKMPKLGSKPIWLVEIIMPKKLMQEIHRGSLEIEDELLDLSDIDRAYEEGLDQDSYKIKNEQSLSPETQNT
ncbi:MAG: hypothetical protein N2235_03160 [Fischerella sp.]|nr:hypothetical protein [Fischerella sp.]